MLLIYIGLGGAMGAICRYLLSSWVGSGAIPFGTLTVNLVGSFLLGLVYSLSAGIAISANLQALIATGLLGAFTTFSTFSYETLSLVQAGQTKNAMIYLSISIILGLIAVAGGHYAGSFFLNLSRVREKSKETQ